MAKVIKKTSLDMWLNPQVIGGAQREKEGCHLRDVNPKGI
jgi:hypothetical protein